ncbi:MAG: hypothetical protein GF364_18000 [Candidatus Lokiarchaeota archaeon]|nr:hypothetical protein [Candidatus Lokiarchaeota archaeon]
MDKSLDLPEILYEISGENYIKYYDKNIANYLFDDKKKELLNRIKKLRISQFSFIDD